MSLQVESFTIFLFGIVPPILTNLKIMIPMQINPKKRGLQTMEEEVEDLNPPRKKQLLSLDLETQLALLISDFSKIILPILGQEKEIKYKELIDNLKNSTISQLKKSCDVLMLELAKESKTNETSSVFLEFSDRVIIFTNEVAEIPKKNMERKAKEVFGSLYQNYSIKITKKTGGSQLGFKLILQKNNEDNSIIYHCKTHSYGRGSKTSSAASSVDLKELLVYRVLEKCNLGNKTIFFFSSLH